MNFEFTDEQKLFADSVRALRARPSREGCARARPRSAFSVRRGAADERAGAHGHHHSGSRRRPRRHADGRRDRHRADRRGVSAQRRRGAVRQFRPDPHLRRIRDAGAEGALAAGSPRRQHGDEPRHDRAGRRLRRHRARDHAPSPTARDTSSTAPRCSRPSARTPRSSSSMCATGPGSTASAR